MGCPAGPPGEGSPGIRPGGRGLCPGADGPILVGWGKTGVGAGAPGVVGGSLNPGEVSLALDEPGSCRRT